MHILLRLSKDCETAAVSVLIGAQMNEEPSPHLQNLWDEERDASMAYQMSWDQEDELSLKHEAPSLLDIALYLPRATEVPLPQAIIEWFDFGFKFVLRSRNGVARWLWMDNYPSAPNGTQRHYFFAGEGEMVPVSVRSQRIIRALMRAYGPTLHEELDDPLAGSHGHWTVNVWLQIDMKEDKPAERMFTTMKVCGDTMVSYLFGVLCDTKARFERFCVMPMKWDEGMLVLGTAYSYQTAIGSGSTVQEMGWEEEVWLWPCRPFDHLESDTGHWESKDLIGFDLLAGGRGYPDNSVDDLSKLGSLRKSDTLVAKAGAVGGSSDPKWGSSESPIVLSDSEL